MVDIAAYRRAVDTLKRAGIYVDKWSIINLTSLEWEIMLFI
jgi:hypothetical protein